MPQKIPNNAEIRQAGTLIQQAQKIAVICSENIDGDSIGGSIALLHALRSIDKEVEAFHCTEVNTVYHFLPAWKDFKVDFNPEDFDLVIFPDTSNPYQTGYDKQYPALFRNESTPVLNIDHHKSNAFFGRVNIVKVGSDSACTIIYHLIKAWNIPISSEIATGLLTGIYNDTNSFMHQTDSNLLRIVSKLLTHGGDLASIKKNMFRDKPLIKLRLWGRVLRKLQRTTDNIITATVSPADFTITGTQRADIAGLSNFISAIPSHFSITLLDNGEVVQGSLRTQNDDLDLTQIASRYGGGGHKKACGFKVPGSLIISENWHIAQKI